MRCSANQLPRFQNIERKISMNKKRMLSFSIIFIIIAVVAILAGRQLAYRSALANSNFLKWCQEVSAEDIKHAKVFSGFAREQAVYQLTGEDKNQLISILKEMTVDDISFRDEYTPLREDDLFLNLASEDFQMMYLFKFTSSGVSVSTTEENSDIFRDRNQLFIESESLISFVKSKELRK